MIQLFEARKSKKVEDNELLEKYLKISKQEKEEILKNIRLLKMEYQKKKEKNYLNKTDQM